MSFLPDTSFLTASLYPASFYPSFAEATAFKIPATQLSQSGIRMGGDRLKDHQVLPEGMSFTAVMCTIAIIAAILTTILEFPVLRRTSWVALSIACVALMFDEVFAFSFASSVFPEQRCSYRA